MGVEFVVLRGGEDLLWEERPDCSFACFSYKILEYIFIELVAIVVVHERYGIVHSVC